jgi:hypothetical protein
VLPGFGAKGPAYKVYGEEEPAKGEASTCQRGSRQGETRCREGKLTFARRQGVSRARTGSCR